MNMLKPLHRVHAGLSKRALRYKVCTEPFVPPAPCPQYTEVALLPNPTADDVLVLMLLASSQGRAAFPNLDVANISWRGCTEVDVTQKPLHVLFIGCGDDPRFNKHVQGVDGVDSNATLMARHLGLLHNPVWTKTLEDVRREDREGGTKQGEIPYMIKAMRHLLDGEPDRAEQVVKWATIAYASEIASLGQLWTQSVSMPIGGFEVVLNTRDPLTTKSARTFLTLQKSPDLSYFNEIIRRVHLFEKAALNEARNIFNVSPGRSGIGQLLCDEFRGVSVVAFKHSNPAMVKVAWERGAHVVVARKPTNGQTAILTRKGSSIDLTSLYDRLRRDEPDQWFMPEHATKLLNGSDRHPHIAPSTMSLHQIVTIVFEVHRAKRLKT